MCDIDTKYSRCKGNNSRYVMDFDVIYRAVVSVRWGTLKHFDHT